MEWIRDNYQWIFSGVGIFLLGIVYNILKGRKNQEKQTLNSPNKNVSNQIKGKNLNINQTFISDSRSGDIRSNIDMSNNDLNTNHELRKSGEDFFSSSNKLRALMIKIIVKARQENSIIEVRTITDMAEDENGIDQNTSFHELEKIEEEKLIAFDEEIVTPYTRIRVTDKFFSFLK